MPAIQREACAAAPEPGRAAFFPAPDACIIPHAALPVRGER